MPAGGDPPLGGMNARDFLSRHWQKAPLLIRQGLPGYTGPVTPDELAGLACEDGVASRIVLERGGSTPWEVRYGPFTSEDFQALPPEDWTLLVQGVDRWVPEAARLLERFDFVPAWRLDDVMVSYAPAGGSVGPHLDAYDVFLIQGHGRRRWQIGSLDGDRKLLPALELRILADFQPEAEWILEPGDVLYLPPGVPHHGVALEPCQTVSVGFRAPSRRDALVAYAEHLAAKLPEDELYADPDLQVAEAWGEITPAAVRALTEGIEALWHTNDVAGWFGRYVTEGADPEPPPALDPRLSTDDFLARFEQVRVMHRNDAVRFAHLRARDAVILFVDGNAHTLPPGLLDPVTRVTGNRELHYHELQPWLGDGSLKELLAGLVNDGYLFLDR